MATKTRTEYCFLRVNTCGNNVTSINIVKNTSLAAIKKEWLSYGPRSDVTPIFKGFTPPLPKKRRTSDDDWSFFNRLFVDSVNKKKSESKTNTSKRVSRGK
jgi:hypothetical protein